MNTIRLMSSEELLEFIKVNGTINLGKTEI